MYDFRAWFSPVIARKSDPGRQVNEKSYAGAERDAKPENSHQNYVHPEVSRETGAHAGNFLAALIQHQSRWRHFTRHAGCGPVSAA
jgi:hypothetical protein